MNEGETPMSISAFASHAEIEAFNAGVQTALGYAKRAAEALATNPSWMPTRIPFAIAALDEFAEAGKSLLLPLPPDDPVSLQPESGDPNPPLAGGGSYDESVRQLKRRITIGGQRYVPIDQYVEALRVSDTARGMVALANSGDAP